MRKEYKGFVQIVAATCIVFMGSLSSASATTLTRIDDYYRNLSSALRRKDSASIRDLVLSSSTAEFSCYLRVAHTGKTYQLSARTYLDTLSRSIAALQPVEKVSAEPVSMRFSGSNAVVTVAYQTWSVGAPVWVAGRPKIYGKQVLEETWSRQGGVWQLTGVAGVSTYGLLDIALAQVKPV